MASKVEGNTEVSVTDLEASKTQAEQDADARSTRALGSILGRIRKLMPSVVKAATGVLQAEAAFEQAKTEALSPYRAVAVEVIKARSQVIARKDSKVTKHGRPDWAGRTNYYQTQVMGPALDAVSMDADVRNRVRSAISYHVRNLLINGVRPPVEGEPPEQVTVRAILKDSKTTAASLRDVGFKVESTQAERTAALQAATREASKLDAEAQQAVTAVLTADEQDPTESLRAALMCLRQVTNLLNREGAVPPAVRAFRSILKECGAEVGIIGNRITEMTTPDKAEAKSA